MWNYRIITSPGEDYFSLHEVFYDDDGSPLGWTEDPQVFTEETPQDVVRSLITALNDAVKLPVLKEKDGTLEPLAWVFPPGEDIE